MICPHCSGDRHHSHGKTAAGSQRFKCVNCGKVFTLNPQKDGPKAIGEKPMTGYERLKRHLAKKKPKPDA